MRISQEVYTIPTYLRKDNFCFIAVIRRAVHIRLLPKSRSLYWAYTYTFSNYLLEIDTLFQRSSSRAKDLNLLTNNRTQNSNKPLGSSSSSIGKLSGLAAELSADDCSIILEAFTSRRSLTERLRGRCSSNRSTSGARGHQHFSQQAAHHKYISLSPPPPLSSKMRLSLSLLSRIFCERESFPNRASVRERTSRDREKRRVFSS